MDLVVKQQEYLPQEIKMIEEVESFLPEFNRASKSFMKGQSQFMDNVLTVSHHTPMKNLYQILAEINQAKDALTESHFKTKLKQNKIKKLKRSLETETDELEKEEIQIKIDQACSQLQRLRGYVIGAVRRIRNHQAQYLEICKTKNISPTWSEKDYEDCEEEHHIKTAITQALHSARGNHGMIDHGNHIYLFQLGINGGTVQRYLNKLFAEERAIAESGDGTKEANILIVYSFIEEMYQHFKCCSSLAAHRKGVSLNVTEAALIGSES